MNTLSLILPVRNEAALIRAQLERLQSYRAAGHEIIVVDGGSRDETVKLTAGLVNRCESGLAGRGLQMNQGAACATGDILLFLHADTQLPPNADELIFAALSRGDGRWGWFDVRLSNPRPSYRLIASFMNLRARLTSVCTGDQALFVDRALFQEIGGFPQLPLMEDIAISKLLRARGRPVRPAGLASASSRRWEEKGLISTVLLMWWLRLLYFTGVKPQRLVEMYYPRRTEPSAATGLSAASSSSCIAVFAREPRLGQVKSRLASEVGEERALAIYRAMLARVGKLLASANMAEWDLWVTSNTSHEDFVSICNKKNIYIQSGEDLGAKMAEAFRHTLEDRRVEHLVLIGTDCPALTEEYLGQAFAALEAGTDVVLGPAEDGGYVLIGMSRALPQAFEAIPWGSDQVLKRTVQALERSGLSYMLLDTLWDVDRPEDLVRLGELQPPLAWSDAK